MIKQYVTVELDKPRALRYGMNALVMIEDLLGKSFTELQDVGFKLKDLRAIIYCGLYQDDKNLTPEQVGNLIDEYSDIETISKKMQEAFEAAFGSKK